MKTKQKKIKPEEIPAGANIADLFLASRINELMDFLKEQGLGQCKINDLLNKGLSSLEERVEKHLVWHEGLDRQVTMLNKWQIAHGDWHAKQSEPKQEWCTCKTPLVCAPEFLYRCSNGGKCHNCEKPVQPKEDKGITE